MQKYFSILISSFILITTLANASQEIQEEIPEEKVPFRIPKVNEQIVVDGVLDEAIWEQALVVDANIEVRPGENIDAPVKTKALFLYTESHVFIGFRCYDPDPSQIRAHFTDRDNIWDDDWILILFDTFNDQRRTYDFVCNPFGIQGDMIETPTGGGDAWDAIWESDGKVTNEGYFVEMAIPFRALGFPRSSEDMIWGFDVVRSYPRSVRHHIGSFPRDRDNNCYMCQSLKMIGFAGASPGKNIEFDPTVSGIVTQEREDYTSGPFNTSRKELDPGITAKWGFTPNLTLGATVNPDFSNIEADIVQLDINTQFALWYPEKRPFFLEGQDFFSTPLNIVYTRTMAEPIWGAKLTGKEGPHGIGYFTVQDELTNFMIPSAEGSSSRSEDRRSTGSVFRYKRDVGESSNLGVIMTDREGDAYYNRLVGFDGDIKFTQTDHIRFQVSGSRTQYPDSIVANFDQPESEFDGMAYQFYYGHDTRNWEVYSFFRQVDEDFRADMGFMTQAGFTYTEVGGSYRLQRDPGSWFTWLGAYTSFNYKRDKFNNPLHKVQSIRLNYEGPMQSHAMLYGEVGHNMYDGEKYRGNWIQGCTGLRPSGLIWMHIYAQYGDQIDYANCQLGERLRISPEVELRLGLRLKVETNYTWERLDVDQGWLYTANIGMLRVIYQFTKRTFLRGIFQYRDYERNVALYNDEETDPRSKGLFTQFLFSYKINPQTVFFLGYSDDYYGDNQIDMTQTNRTIFAKLGYAYML
ncbi:carbohydrate binding family 9 domain-containing protein [candidate division KSB1 bacterium]|nr:carbohydrate binding family 9 domain-containing protein [candidate division KSB1 bacterium]